MLRRISRLLLAGMGILAFDVSLAASGAGNLESVMNAFIATIAKEHVGLKAEIRVLKPGETVPAGFQVGRSSKAGDYVFRPKSWSDLTPTEQGQLLKHVKLKAFLVSLRNERVYPVLSSANTAEVPSGWTPVEGAKPSTPEYRVKIEAAEMLRNRTAIIPVYPTAAK